MSKNFDASNFRTSLDVIEERMYPSTSVRLCGSCDAGHCDLHDYMHKCLPRKCRECALKRCEKSPNDCKCCFQGYEKSKDPTDDDMKEFFDDVRLNLIKKI